MRVIFASGHPHLPELTGGLQSNTHQLAQALLHKGHAVAVLAGLSGEGPIGFRDRVLIKFGNKAPRDDGLGYPVFRHWFAEKAIDTIVRNWRPDVVIIQSGRMVPLIEPFELCKLPILLYLHNVEYSDHGGEATAFLRHRAIANSRFTAERYKMDFGLESEVINPIIPRMLYTTSTSREVITFVNPHPSKGVEMALEIATECPDISFEFIEGWTLDEADQAALMTRLASLPNVTLIPRTNDMKAVYSRSRLVIIPSKWEETWGRVASEAQCSGIPVIATRCGGLHESVGPGGVLIGPNEPVSEWVNVIRDLWINERGYNQLVQKALIYAARPQLQPEVQIAQIEAALLRVVNSC